MPTFLVTAFAPDRTGLIADIAGRLFEMGANLGDTTFAVLGSAAEFSSVVEMPEGSTPDAVQADLKLLPELAAARIEVLPFEMNPHHEPQGHITHRIAVTGGDRPGLIARLSELFGQYHANIVRMNAQRIPGPDGGTDGSVLVTRFAVSIPPESEQACLASAGNTAGELGLSFDWEKA